MEGFLLLLFIIENLKKYFLDGNRITLDDFRHWLIDFFLNLRRITESYFP